MKYFLLNGPTAAGKTTLLEYLLSESGDYLEPIVSFTTRAPRAEEQNGKDYYFITREQYLELKTNDRIVERIKYLDNNYGVTRQELQRVEATRKNGIAVMTVAGIRKLKQNVDYQKVISIFVYRDLSDIFQSIKVMGYPEAETARRMELARREMRDITTCDYVVYNTGSLAQANQQLTAIIKKEINSQALKMEIHPGQKYRHFSGETCEIVCGLAEHTETLSPMVVYRSDRTGLLYARPYEIFCGKKEWPPNRGHVVPRFELIQE